MTNFPTQCDATPTRIASYLLLVLLVSNLFHNSLHTCNSTGYRNYSQLLPRSGSFNKSSEGSGSDKLPTCLACICKRQQFAVFPSRIVVAEPGQIGSTFVEPCQALNHLLYQQLNLSRAPPFPFRDKHSRLSVTL